MSFLYSDVANKDSASCDLQINSIKNKTIAKSKVNAIG